MVSTIPKLPKFQIPIKFPIPREISVLNCHVQLCMFLIGGRIYSRNDLFIIIFNASNYNYNVSFFITNIVTNDNYKLYRFIFKLLMIGRFNFKSPCGRVDKYKNKEAQENYRM
uniref:Uncharacterized protein n=1 Tax=Rhizophagus irregularis (strain DAOM 181602 / DAOM 197198 / MUCL 43194) TaxID=747089 RepID=U9SLH4_RHIID